jgi:hypothetical protein
MGSDIVSKDRIVSNAEASLGWVTQSVRSMFDVLVEVFTNCDDSYHRMFSMGEISKDGGRIYIDIDNKKEKETNFTVRDHAEGLSGDEMWDKLRVIGCGESGDGSRGVVGGGAKTYGVLGAACIESIKNNKYSKMRIFVDGQVTMEVKDKMVTPYIRKRLNIKRKNGTVVSVTNIIFPVESVETIINRTLVHPALRMMLRKSSPTHLFVKEMDHDEKFYARIFNEDIKGGTVLDKEFEVKVDGYPTYKPRLRIWDAKEPYNDATSNIKNRYSGILMLSKRTIFENLRFFDSGLNTSPFMTSFCGLLECDYIYDLIYQNKHFFDVLKIDSIEKIRANKELIKNNRSVFDRSRYDGLIREHPFVKKMLEIASDLVLTFSDDIIQKNNKGQSNLMDRAHRKELDSATRALAIKMGEDHKKLWKTTPEKSDMYIPDEDISGTSKSSNKQFLFNRGAVIIPGGFTTVVGNRITASYHAYRNSDELLGKVVNIECDSDLVTIETTSFQLKEHPVDEYKLVGSFKMRTNGIGSNIQVVAKCVGLPDAVLNINVVAEQDLVYKFSEGKNLEFSARIYSVKEGQTKNIKLFLKSDVVDSDKELEMIRIRILDARKFKNGVKEESEDGLQLRTNCIFKLHKSKQYYEGYFKVYGVNKNEKAVIEAKYKNETRHSAVKVLQGNMDCANIKVNYTKEDVGSRYRWKGNNLLISEADPTVKLLLGKGTNGCSRKITHEFRILVAEIITEAFVFKWLTEIDIFKNEEDYNTKDNLEKVTTVFYKFREKQREYAEIVHKHLFKKTQE